MKKCIIVLFAIAVSGMTLESCTDYLSVRPDRSLAVPQTLKDLQAILHNETGRNTNYPYTGEIGSDYFYLSDADFYGRNEETRNLYIWDPQAQAEQDWLNAYFRVFDLNVVLDAVDVAQRGSLNESVRGEIRGAALFFRGWLFFQLAQLYAPPYEADKVDKLLGIPIRLTPNIEAPTIRATLSETYNQITEDLESAAKLLPATTTLATKPSKATAHAALARVYLNMGDYANSLRHAEASLSINNVLMDFNALSLTESKPIPVLNEEVLIHLLLPNGGGVFSNTRAKVDPELFASYHVDDLRRGIFFKPNADGTYRFTGDYGRSADATIPFCGLATDEVYLTKAECLARIGDTESALATLNQLLVTRWADGRFVPYTAASPDETLALIIAERHKELAFRGGIRWGDLKRLNLEPQFARTLTRQIDGLVYTLEPNDPRYTLLIPESVIFNTGITQNGR